MKPRTIQIIITVCAVGVALLHAWLPSIQIDAITVTLIGIAVIPWLGTIFKSVELPGGVKVEYQDLEKAAQKVEDSGLIGPGERLKPMQNHVYSFQTVSRNDPNLALSGLRIEIESRLKKLAENHNVKIHRQGVNALTRALEKVNVLAHEEAAAIRDLLPLLNQAAHGAEVEDSAFGWAMSFGPKVLGALEDRIGEITTHQLVESWRKRDGAAFQEVGTELSKSFVQSPEVFLAAMSQNTKDFNDWLDGIEAHTFTIYESRTELDDELYHAYYEKLKSLMLHAAEAFESSAYSDEAKRIINALRKVEIRRVW
jgi:hypothetical protein